MSENKIQTDEGENIKSLNDGSLYLVSATLSGDDEQGKKMHFNVHSYIIAPISMKEEEVEAIFKKQIDLDKDDKITFKKVKPGECFQFVGYSDNHQLEDGLKEGDVFTFKRCGLEYVETFEKAPNNEGVGWLFKPSELGMFPPPSDDLFVEVDTPITEENKTDQPKEEGK